MARRWGRIAALGLALSFAVVCSAAAQSDSAPPEGAPWLNIIPDQTREPEWRFGDLSAGEVIARVPMRYGATGRITQDVIGDNGAFTRDRVIIPAGTPVFAVTFAHTSQYAPTSPRRVTYWCGALEEPSALFNDGRGFCVQTDAEPNSNNICQMALGQGDFAQATTSNERGTPYFPRTVVNAGRLRSEVFVALEPIDFPVTLSLEYRVLEPRGERWINIEVVGSDGTTETQLDFILLRRGEPTLVAIGGRPMVMEYLESGQVRVRPAAQ
jgi:hypothetical protein